VCQHEYGVCPGYEITEPTAHASRESFPYIPSHLYHILFELFKNSMRAVVESHGDRDEDDEEPLPPIRVILVRGKSDITIKISDEGGGIPRADMPFVTSYVYTTARVCWGWDGYRSMGCK
jgi:pyruvate dehydrogenase kinase 2/3/4